MHAKEWLKEDHKHGGGAGPQAGASSGSWASTEDPLAGLIEALITKVAAMTMLDRDEVGVDTALASFSLDSLVSVESRNWIRRETGVDLLLSSIMQAESLRAMATEIMEKRKETEGM